MGKKQKLFCQHLLSLENNCSNYQVHIFVAYDYSTLLVILYVVLHKMLVCLYFYALMLHVYTSGLYVMQLLMLSCFMCIRVACMFSVTNALMLSSFMRIRVACMFSVTNASCVYECPVCLAVTNALMLHVYTTGLYVLLLLMLSCFMRIRVACMSSVTNCRTPSQTTINKATSHQAA